MPDAIFPKGMFIKRNQKAPDFVIGKISIKVDEFVEFMKQHESNGWVNFDCKKKKADGSPYIELDTWKPDVQNQSQPQEQKGSFEEDYGLPGNEIDF